MLGRRHLRVAGIRDHSAAHAGVVHVHVAEGDGRLVARVPPEGVGHLALALLAGVAGSAGAATAKDEEHKEADHAAAEAAP